MPNPKSCRVLWLKVRDGSITWTLYGCDQEDQLGQVLNDGKEELALDKDPLRKKTIDLLVEVQQLLADLLREGSHSESVDRLLDKLVEVLGEHMYGFLFKGRIDNNLNEVLNDINTGQLRLLRVALEFAGNNEELTSWPWEYLHSPKALTMAETGRFLTRHAQLMVNRRLTFEAGNPRDLKTPKPTVLLVVSRPKGPPPLQSTTALETIQKLKERGLIELVELIQAEQKSISRDEPVATAEKFKKLVEDKKPHIIHFIGHGRRQEGKGQLAFVGADGGQDWKDDKDFADWAAQSPNLKLVFLQACESALPDPRASVSGVARQLAHKNIPAVVAMQEKVEVWIADTIASKFYEALATGVPVDLAVKEGIKALSSLSTPAFGVPVLYLNSYERMIDQTGPADERLASVPSVQVPVSSVQPAAPRACPRCKTPPQQQAQKYCTECGLGFNCERCGILYGNPLGKYCGECGASISQPLWPEADLLRPVGPIPPVGERPPQQDIPEDPELTKELSRRFPRRRFSGSRVSGVAP